MLKDEVDTSDLESEGAAVEDAVKESSLTLEEDAKCKCVVLPTILKITS